MDETRVGPWLGRIAGIAAIGLIALLVSRTGTATAGEVPAGEVAAYLAVGLIPLFVVVAAAGSLVTRGQGRWDRASLGVLAAGALGSLGVLPTVLAIRPGGDLLSLVSLALELVLVGVGAVAVALLWPELVSAGAARGADRPDPRPAPPSWARTVAVVAGVALVLSYLAPSFLDAVPDDGISVTGPDPWFDTAGRWLGASGLAALTVAVARPVGALTWTGLVIGLALSRWQLAVFGLFGVPGPALYDPALGTWLATVGAVALLAVAGVVAARDEALSSSPRVEHPV